MLYGQPLHRIRCSYDNSTTFSVNKLKKKKKKKKKKQWRFSPFFPSLTFLSNLFCFRSLCQRVVFLNLMDIKVNPNCLLFSHRERDRETESERENESPKSSREGVVVWCDGAG